MINKKRGGPGAPLPPTEKAYVTGELDLTVVSARNLPVSFFHEL